MRHQSSAMGLLVVSFFAGCGSEVDLLGRSVEAIHSKKDAAAPISATACDPSRFPISPSKPPPPSCCMDGDDEWLIIGGPTGGGLGHRAHGGACTSDGTTVGCGTGAAVQCVFGPCGARVVETFAAPAHVFIPLSNPTVCGREATGLAGVPEEWTDATTAYAGVTPSCTYTACLPDGTPVVSAVSLVVTAVVNGATGKVRTHPKGIKLAGAATGSWGFETGSVIELHAKPHGRYARATFTGGCAATGGYGDKVLCTMTVSANAVVTVTYDCQTGRTCKLDLPSDDDSDD